MDKKKSDILFLCQFFYPEYISSATLPFDTALAYVKEGFSVGVLCGYPKEYSCERNVPKKETYQGIDIRRIKYLQLSRRNILGRSINYFSFLFATVLNLPVFRKYKYIIVYSNPPILPVLAAIAKKLCRYRLIFVSYDVYPEIGIQSQKIKKNGFIDKLFKISNKFIFNSIDKVIVLSEDMKTLLCKERNLQTNKVVVIPNWGEEKPINTKKNINNPLFADIPSDAFVISYLGNLGICQDEKTILQVMERLKGNAEIHFLIAGHGVKMSMLRDEVLKKGLERVHIYEFLHGKDYEDALGLSSVCVATLIEGMQGLCSPSKVSNYLMVGKPILMVCESGIELAEDVLKYACGYRIQPGDIDAMETAILEQFWDKDIHQKMGQNSRTLFEEKYEKSICLRKYITLIKNELL